MHLYWNCISEKFSQYNFSHIFLSSHFLWLKQVHRNSNAKTLHHMQCTLLTHEFPSPYEMHMHPVYISFGIRYVCVYGSGINFVVVSVKESKKYGPWNGWWHSMALNNFHNWHAYNTFKHTQVVNIQKKKSRQTITWMHMHTKGMKRSKNAFVRFVSFLFKLRFIHFIRCTSGALVVAIIIIIFIGIFLF